MASNILTINNSYGSKSETEIIVERLSRIVDVSKLSPKFLPEPSIKFTQLKSLFWGCSVRFIDTESKWIKNGYKKEIRRKDIDGWPGVPFTAFYYQTDSTVKRKDAFILSNSSNFATIRKIDNEALYTEHVADNLDSSKSKWTRAYVDTLIAKRDQVWRYLISSADIKSYDAVAVPDTFTTELKELGETIVEEIKEQEKSLSPMELRKLGQQTVIHALQFSSRERALKEGKNYHWKKQEPKIEDLKNESSIVYYGTGEDEELLQFTALLTHRLCNGNFFDAIGIPSKEFKLIKVSQSLPKKFITNHKHIGEFYKTPMLITNQVGMSSFLVRWNTAKYIKGHIRKLVFFENFGTFRQDLQTIYRELVGYANSNFADVEDFVKGNPKLLQMYEATSKYCDKVSEMQLYLREHKDNTEAIAQKSKELFSIDTVDTALGYDLDKYDKLHILLEYAEPVYHLFNYISVLNKSGENVPFETESLIKEIILNKGLADFKTGLEKESEVQVKQEEVLV